MHFKNNLLVQFVMLRLRPKAISASNVKATLLGKVIRPLKLLFFCFKKALGTFLYATQNQLYFASKNFPSAWLSADFWQICLKN